jgi:hypothetical protein
LPSTVIPEGISQIVYFSLINLLINKPSQHA